MPPSVRVPVLSSADDVDPGQALDRGQLLDEALPRPSLMTPIAKATEVSSTSPSGTIGTIAADRAASAGS